MSELNGNTLCYRFQLNNFTLDITDNTVQAVNDFVVTSGLHTVELANLADALFMEAVDGLITKDQYDVALENLLQFTSMNEADERLCISALSSIYYAFDRTDSDVVDALEIVCGLSVLCRGYVFLV